MPEARESAVEAQSTGSAMKTNPPAIARFFMNWIFMFRSAKFICATSAVAMHHRQRTSAVSRV